MAEAESEPITDAESKSKPEPEANAEAMSEQEAVTKAKPEAEAAGCVKEHSRLDALRRYKTKAHDMSTRQRRAVSESLCHCVIADEARKRWVDSHADERTSGTRRRQSWQPSWTAQLKSSGQEGQGGKTAEIADS